MWGTKGEGGGNKRKVYKMTLSLSLLSHRNKRKETGNPNSHRRTRGQKSHATRHRCDEATCCGLINQLDSSCSECTIDGEWP